MTKNKLTWFLLIGAFWCAADLYTKDRALEFLPKEGQTHAVFGETFQLANHHNTGGMWGVGKEWNPWILRTVRLFAVVVIFVILLQTPATDRISIVALGLVLGGAVGNIYDSLQYGFVRDFLMFDFGFPPFDPFPTFNVADSGICIGVGLLAIQMIRHPDPTNAAAGEPAAGSGPDPVK